MADIEKEKAEIQELAAHLDDEYRKASISEESYKEMKEKYSKMLAEIEAKQKDKKETKAEVEPAAKKGIIKKLFSRDKKKTEEKEKKDKEEPAVHSDPEEKLYGAGTAEDPYRSTPEVQKPQEDSSSQETAKQESSGVHAPDSAME